MQNVNYETQLVRHGELLLIPIDELPAGAEQVFEGKEFIVAHSETGHHHVAVGNITMFRPAGGDSADMYLRANAASRLVHKKSFDKHETKSIPEGLYICRPKTEYDPFAKLIQQVRD